MFFCKKDERQKNIPGTLTGSVHSSGGRGEANGRSPYMKRRKLFCSIAFWLILSVPLARSIARRIDQASKKKRSPGDGEVIIARIFDGSLAETLDTYLEITAGQCCCS